jgi:hypothetical protein
MISVMLASGGHEAALRMGGSSEKDSRIRWRAGLATRVLLRVSFQDTSSLRLFTPRNGARAMLLPEIIKSGRISRQNVFHWSGVLSSGESGVSGTPIFIS